MGMMQPITLLDLAAIQPLHGSAILVDESALIQLQNLKPVKIDTLYGKGGSTTSFNLRGGDFHDRFDIKTYRRDGDANIEFKGGKGKDKSNIISKFHDTSIKDYESAKTKEDKNKARDSRLKNMKERA
mmetsp:Transcript_18303/g.31312  ORF Transcript_18303/g.31312 Transcript_18303/m.31312 type:complete len:128 (+) Transcript_18303:40-423(+)|eukprot:CAMPEP_0168618676 /NCGR_PEP_ID=MMETSP0449_2-20121227/6196_1 /TAXON_ID=1082188 /ORGANISM="Strombidium rassoulzadegani, Strain ras09" /LENGTH=127 /DNA_ID=CAMNT_0008659561 /DNA_START=18 /DNA_END=401 /DNA_ORIENTATION=+